MYKEKVHTFSNGVKVLCCTPHNCTFDDSGKLVEVEKCGAVLAAKAISKETETRGAARLMAADFVGTDEGFSELQQLRAELGDEFGNVIIVGSMISAQAYPGFVFSLVPAPGYERVPPDQKRMRTDQFTTFKK